MSSIAAPTNDPMFDVLWDSIQTQRCVAFIGAGMSIPDYPLWDDLIAKLMKACNYKQPFDNSMSNPEVAARLKKHDETAYWKALRSEFRRIKNPRSIHRFHMLARIPFVSYITTNFDPLLVDTAHLHRNVTCAEYPWLPSGCHGNQEIFFVHGRIDPDSPTEDTPNIVFTQKDYDDAYDHSGSKLHAFLQDALTEYDVCFLGCGLKDDYLQNVFRMCKQIKGKIWDLRVPNPPRWFAVVSQHYKVPPDFESEFGIHVIRYPSLDHEYAVLDQLLEFFARSEKPRLRKPRVGGPNLLLPQPEGPR